MAIGIREMAIITSIFGVASFVCGVYAENYKAAAGTPIQGNGVVICKYPSADHYIYLGYGSAGSLILCCLFGYKSLRYPYNKKSIPRSKLFATTSLVIFYNIAWMSAVLGLVLLLWPTIVQHLHSIHNVHSGSVDYTCPTAKTGVIGGGAFVALDSSLFWLICMMLAVNAREDYFDELEESNLVVRNQVINVDFRPS